LRKVDIKPRFTKLPQEKGEGEEFKVEKKKQPEEGGKGKGVLGGRGKILGTAGTVVGGGGEKNKREKKSVKEKASTPIRETDGKKAFL